jgi:hypothetical protein
LDITQLILDDHHEQRRLFAMLDQIGDRDTKSLAGVWGRLATFLEVHAKAEEDHFYPALLKVGEGEGGKRSAKTETLDAIKDHNEIRDAVAAVAGQKPGSAAWRRAVAAANKANGEHMDEEERQGLADFRRHATLQVRHDLAVKFAAFEALHVMGVPAVDQSPRVYVAKNG